MNMSNLLRALLIVPLLALVLLLSGCSNSNKAEIDPADAPGGNAGKTRVKVTFGKPGSGIRQVRHFIAADGVTVEARETEFSDEHTLMEVLFTSGPAKGKVKEATETHARSKVVRTHTVYSEQQEIVSQEEYRSDAKLASTRLKLPDGTVESRLYQRDGKTLESIVLRRPDRTQETRRFQQDGTTLYSIEVLNPDSSRETTNFRKDGKRLFSVEKSTSYQNKDSTYYRQDGKTVWAKINTRNGDQREVEAYNPDGTLAQKRQLSWDGSTLDVTIYGGAPASAKFHQKWRHEGGYWWKTYSLDSVEAFGADGKTVEKLYEYFSDGRTLKQLTTNNADGTKSVKYFRLSGGTLEKEETYDAAGKVVKTEDFEDAKGIHEQVGAELSQLPDFDDPSGWGVLRD
jgi:antitoxin component YwqK of YwqJK toxin-antitoxin module